MSKYIGTVVVYVSSSFHLSQPLYFSSLSTFDFPLLLSHSTSLFLKVGLASIVSNQCACVHCLSHDLLVASSRE